MDISIASITESALLLNAQLSFLDTHVALIHIPLSLYPMFIQPILQLLLHNDHLDPSTGQPIHPGKPWFYWHPFVNISLTPHECSIVCPREQATKFFAPILANLIPPPNTGATISREDYSVIAIGGPGMDAGARVLDLTSPLAMAGIPIFFITSYYLDYILVPHAARQRVISALETRGFVLEPDSPDGESGHMTNPASPLFSPHNNNNHFFNHNNTSNSSSPILTAARKNSVGSLFDFPQPTLTPPASTLAELQTRTFNLLRKHAIRPVVDRSVELVTCGGFKDATASASAANFTAGKLMLGLIKCLTLPPASPRSEKVGDGLEDGVAGLGLHQDHETNHDQHCSAASDNSIEADGVDGVDGSSTTPASPSQSQSQEAPQEPPKFLSLTLTNTESLSVTLETRLIPLFHNDGEELLLGARDGPVQIPITFDLADLPLESTGIVCGVASRVSDGMQGRIGREMFNLSYLSTARAGHVVVYEEELEDAVEALQGLGEEREK